MDMTKWSEVKRSETPLNWKRMLDHLTITPERLSNFLTQLAERRNKMDPNEEVVDMDEVSKSAEVLDETEPEEAEDPEPEDED